MISGTIAAPIVPSYVLVLVTAVIVSTSGEITPVVTGTERVRVVVPAVAVVHHTAGRQCQTRADVLRAVRLDEIRRVTPLQAARRDHRLRRALVVPSYVLLLVTAVIVNASAEITPVATGTNVYE